MEKIIWTECAIRPSTTIKVENLLHVVRATADLPDGSKLAKVVTDVNQYGRSTSYTYRQRQGEEKWYQAVGASAGFPTLYHDGSLLGW